MNYREINLLTAHNYEVELTGDRSPTLRILQMESMHNRRGAAAEAVYLYYEAMARYKSLVNQEERSEPLDVLSFGFGLGYNEILTVIFFLKNNWDLNQLRLFSQEKDLFLYDIFNDWLVSGADTGSIFDEVVLGIERAMLAMGEGVSKVALKENMKWMLNSKRWVQGGSVSSISDFASIYDVVFYDAFSSKVDDSLWTEEFLGGLFSQRLKQNFVFSTYACTGALKRIAAANSAQFVKREGYSGKRNASLVYRDR